MNIDEASDELFGKFMQGIQLINKSFEVAGRWLWEDMERSTSYEPHREGFKREQKDYYTFRANNKFGIRVMGKPEEKIHPFYSDFYYAELINIINQYEDISHKHFNKGIVFANLGIAQIAQNKFDAGIAHLLTAEWEDREVANPKEFILDSRLWGQFEHKVFSHLDGLFYKTRNRFHSRLCVFGKIL